LLIVGVVEVIDRLAVFAMGIIKVPVIVAEDRAIEAGRDAQKAVDIARTDQAGWPRSRDVFAELEGVARLNGIGAGQGAGLDLDWIGAVIAQRGLYRGRQEGIVLVEGAGLQVAGATRGGRSLGDAG